MMTRGKVGQKCAAKKVSWGVEVACVKGWVGRGGH